jgi:hypothetical protein
MKSDHITLIFFNIIPSFVFKLYIEQILSSPPQATKFPEGAYAQVITQDERSGMACTLFVV